MNQNYFLDQPFVPVVLGANLGAYSLAREFHEMYGLKTLCFAPRTSVQVQHSQIVDVFIDEELVDDVVLVEHILSVVLQNPGRPIMLLGCGDDWALQIMRVRDRLPEVVKTPYAEHDLADRLSDKSNFYNVCEELGINYPKTFLFSQDSQLSDLPFDYPIVIKPNDQVQYDKYGFVGKKKVFFIDNAEEAADVVVKIFAAGYSADLVIQEMIPGDDTNMFTCNAYVDPNGHVAWTSVGNVLIEEKTPTGLGNHNLIISTENETIEKQVTQFLQHTGYRGLANFDVKRDPRDGSYRFFEINVRQGNSHYFSTAAGKPVVQQLVHDFIGKNVNSTQQNTEQETIMSHIIPKIMFSWVVKDEVTMRQVKKLLQNKKNVHPLYYAADMSLKRRLSLWKNSLGHIKKYFQFY